MNDVLDFWFKELSPKDWWVKNEELYKLIATRFLETHQKAIRGELFYMIRLHLCWRNRPSFKITTRD